MIVGFPAEMLEAGIQALKESEGMEPDQRVVLIYLAVDGVKEILLMQPKPEETRH